MINAHAFRRYLQPSSKLRWHPWAPLVAGFLIVGFVFVLGAQWGYAAAKRDQSRTDQYAYAFTVLMEHLSKYPAREVMRRAGTIDAAIIRHQRESGEKPGPWQLARSEAEEWLFPRKPLPMRKQHMVDLAEFRLRELSGAAPAWQVTKNYCEESAPVLTGRDLREPYRETAQAYSTLLGRTIAAEQLAPAVPGARCEGKPRRVS